jgi:glucose-6-phosphate dehydrogenase assembly protein OpcA
VRAIEQQLRELRAEDREGDAPAGRYADIRMAVLNLIVVAFRRQLAEGAAETLATLAGRYPSRALVVLAEPQAPESRLDAHVAAHCQWSPGGTQQVCSEQVVLRARGAVVDHLASVITPLLISDLKAVVWWHGMPDLEAALFRQLLDIADRFLVDSQDFATPADGLRGLLEATGQTRQACSLVDLAWIRLTPWREVVAACFEGEQAPRMQDVRQVTIECDRQLAFSEALLCAGWLRGQLSPRLPVQLRPGPSGTGLHAIRIDAGSSGKPVRLAVARRGPAIHVESSGAAGATRTARLLNAQGAEALAVALAQFGQDPVFRRAVQHLPATESG